MRRLTVSLLAVVALFLGCEIDTRLNLTGDNPPVFQMSGNGGLSSIRVRGPNKQRNVDGEDAWIYWEIHNNGPRLTVGELGSVTYGKIPAGYAQKYPETGTAPNLDEGERYYIRVTTVNANGDEGYFTILNGRPYYSRIESELPKKPAAH